MTDISIIVPIYNAEKYLKKCIDSLISQTKKELEFILVNDGSTDSSENIIKNYSDKRIKYFKNKNQGIGKTRNFGIEKSTGKYIMFLDSDDYLDKNACKFLFNKIEKEKLDIVVCDFYKDIDGKIVKEQIPSFKSSSLEENNELLLNINLAPWNKIYRSELIKKNNIKFVENLKYEDAPFVAECLLKAKKIGKIDNCLNYYVIHKNSETTTRDKKMFDIIKIVDIIRDKYKNTKYMDTVNTLTIKILVNYTIQQRENKNEKERNEFINKVFNYFEKNIPNYRRDAYFKKRNIFKRIIERNKLVTKVYCKIYSAMRSK